MDVIALHQAGITNVVAPLGTAVTDSHLQMLWRSANEPVICLDGDAAGKRAMLKTAERALPLLQPSLSLKFALLPEGQDPDDIIQQHGVKRMRELLMQAAPLSDVLWDMTLAAQPTSTPEHKAAFETALMQYVSQINNSTVQHHYRNHYRNRLREWQYASRFNTTSREHLPTLKVQQAMSARERYEITLVTILLYHPELITDHAIESVMQDLPIPDDTLSGLRDAIISASNEVSDPSYDTIHHALVHAGFESYMKRIEQDSFLDRMAKPGASIELAQQAWNFVYANYQAACLEEEYKARAKELAENDETAEQVMALLEQLQTQKKLVEKEKISYETLAGD